MVAWASGVRFLGVFSMTQGLKFHWVLAGRAAWFWGLKDGFGG